MFVYARSQGEENLMKKSFSALMMFLFIQAVFSKEVKICSEPVEFLETFIPGSTNVSASFIDYEQLISDLNYADYYLRTAYMGYKEMVAAGYKKQELFDYFELQYSGKKNIEVYEFVLNLYKFFQKFVKKDCHFILEFDNQRKYINVCSKGFFFYSNTFVEKKDGKYFVIETDCKTLKPGDKYTGKDNYLFKYPAKGKNVYRLGCIDNAEKKSCSFSFNNNAVDLDLHNDGAINISQNPKYHEIETNDSVYISLSSFNLPDNNSPYRKGADIVFEKFANIRNRFIEKKNIIIDLRSNTGGREVYGEFAVWNFLNKNGEVFSEKSYRKMYEFLDSNFYRTSYVVSPAAVQARLQLFIKTGEEKTSYGKQLQKKLKEFKKTPEKIIYENQVTQKNEAKPYFDGNIIFLIDRNTMSACERMICLSKKLLNKDKVFVIGENSGGCAVYTDVLNYLLPGSGISIRLGANYNSFYDDFAQWHGEGIGIFPDYWSTGEDLNETIFLATNDEALKEKLSKIGERVY